MSPHDAPRDDDHGPIAPPPGSLNAVLARGDRPYVTLKAAATLDGRLATRSGQSQWITGEPARAHALRLRAGHDAVLVGRGTVAADDPRLTVRPPASLPPGRPQPARVVLDSLARTAATARLLAADGARRLIVVGSEAPSERIAALKAIGVEVLRCSTSRPAAAEYLPALRGAGLQAVLVEGGAEVHAELIAQGAANALFLYIGGCMIGDPDAPAWCGPLGVRRLQDAPRVRLGPPHRIGDDVLLQGFFD